MNTSGVARSPSEEAIGEHAGPRRTAADDDTVQLCTFRLDDRHYAIHVLEVQEVLGARVMTPVPLAPDGVSGLLNLRGQIITAIDLRNRLGRPPRDPDVHAVNLVVTHGETPVSLLVDEIGSVLQVDVDRYEPPPPTVAGSARSLISGVYRVDGPLLHVLDVEQVLADLAASAAPIWGSEQR